MSMIIWNKLNNLLKHDIKIAKMDLTEIAERTIAINENLKYINVNRDMNVIIRENALYDVTRVKPGNEKVQNGVLTKNVKKIDLKILKKKSIKNGS